MPDAVSVAALGRAYDLVSAPGGAALLDAQGVQLDFEAGPPVAAVAALWDRLAGRLGGAEPGPAGTGLVAVGGFAFRPEREPAGPWAGFPAVLLRVPALAVTRVRGRTYASAASAGAEELLELPPAFRAPAARALELTPERPPAEWQGAVAEAARRLTAGEAHKVVLAREVVARADGAIAAAAVARALRAAYPACFTYLVTGADGTAFIGASPELLVRRAGRTVTAQPMAGSVARGADEAEDERLAASLLGERFLAEHRVVPEWVTKSGPVKGFRNPRTSGESGLFMEKTTDTPQPEYAFESSADPVQRLKGLNAAAAKGFHLSGEISDLGILLQKEVSR